MYRPNNRYNSYNPSKDDYRKTKQSSPSLAHTCAVLASYWNTHQTISASCYMEIAKQQLGNTAPMTREGICRQQKMPPYPAVSCGPMCPHQDLAGAHGRQTSPQEEVTVGETQFSRAHSLDSVRKMGKAPTVRVQPPPQIAELNTSTWLIFSLCQMLKHRSMCSGNTDTTAGSGDVLLGNQFAVYFVKRRGEGRGRYQSYVFGHRGRRSFGVTQDDVRAYLGARGKGAGKGSGQGHGRRRNPGAEMDKS